jgi:hypothetical protein
MMTKQIILGGNFYASWHFDNLEPHGLWRDATGRAAGVGTAAQELIDGVHDNGRGNADIPFEVMADLDSIGEGAGK